MPPCFFRYEPIQKRADPNPPKQANDQNFLARPNDLEVALGKSKLDAKGNR
jgi:hypothetical protein